MRYDYWLDFYDDVIFADEETNAMAAKGWELVHMTGVSGYAIDGEEVKGGIYVCLRRPYEMREQVEETQEAQS